MRYFSARPRRFTPDAPRPQYRDVPSRRPLVGAADHEPWLHLGRILTSRDAVAEAGLLTSFMVSEPLGLCFHLRPVDHRAAGLVVVTVATLQQRGPEAAVEAVAFLNQLGTQGALPPCNASKQTPVLGVW